MEIKFSMGKKIEVFVDSDTGIHIDECAQVSRFVEANLDGSGLVPDNYILEVSSPGMSNPLKVPRQYKRRIGRKLEVLKINGEMLLVQLVAVHDDRIVLTEVKEEKSKKKQKEDAPKEQKNLPEFELKYSEIKRSVLVFNF
ncbi:MAG: ribosome maturation factor RimP [Bacteroidetes bacterium]|nr:ribosome maturation factor RimP [Bacteroidota bacterium]